MAPPSPSGEVGRLKYSGEAYRSGDNKPGDITPGDTTPSACLMATEHKSDAPSAKMGLR